MNMTTVDPANVVSFVKNNYPDVIRHVPDINFYQLIRKKRNVFHLKRKDIAVKSSRREEAEVR